MKNIVILGSTGSIGASTLDIVSRFPDQFSIVGLTAGNNHEKLEEQIRAFRPRIVALSSETAANALRTRLNGSPVEILSGVEGLCTVAQDADSDIVISAIVGGAGLRPTMAALRAGRHVALANKEPMVMVGHLMQEEAQKQGTTIFPIDSEHSAIFQSLEGHRHEDVRRIVLTASGGPFWDWPLESIQEVTVEQALKHPNWEMGAKITIDSATLMNKGLEVIEAKWLFTIPASQINIVIHRESIIHSLVEYRDGSVMAQLGLPDMRTPISYALNYPKRVPLDPPLLDLATIGQLHFAQPDFTKFPCARLAYDALAEGGGLPATLNAANEVAVQAFLDQSIAFLDIPKIIEETMMMYSPQELRTIEDALEVDRWAREKASALCALSVK
ncbi:MAG: 1-deoxy-D-xylulose-5-phosphate reductoisomerase [Nitrospirales bacterium]|nr:1-deoxy-D-xylulose-5-phosphate reductoisomerase [Nitrospira sp.]MDR4501954.1 1-deoxy-D-xylulose-5-phosphate reductoisomerase [Nitrospirales bacterium]